MPVEQRGRPDFVIIGAPKTGTTSLAAWLSDHPRVAMSATKELEFLNKHWERGLDWYAAQVPQAPDDLLVGEATPGYLAHPLAPARAATALPDTKFIAVLREPVDRAWSYYCFLRMLGVEHRSFTAALAREAAGRGPADYLAAGRYAEHLARWDAAVGRDRLLVLLFDDLRSNPADMYGQVCSFIGAPVVSPTSLEAVNPTLESRSLALQLLLHRTGLARRSRRFEALHAWNRTGPRPAGLDPILAENLRAQFVDQIAPLERRVGRPLPAHWLPKGARVPPDPT